MKSLLREVQTHSGVVVEYGDTRIEFPDDRAALKFIEDMGYGVADIVYPDGTHTTVNRS